MPDPLDLLIHQPVRLRLMTLLHRNREASFAWCQATLELTPGNLDSHAKRLADGGYVEYGRVLTAAGFESRIRITRRGDQAFVSYRSALRALLESDAASAPQNDGDVK